jgi:2-oxoglutarate ferredoxin oxidoreductase subunit beta
MKGGKFNNLKGIDLCELAIVLGATYIGRSFSGDRKQLAPLIQGALAHKGTAILDVLSPCVTFNNHEGSTKSMKNIKYNLDPIHDIDFIPPEEDIRVEYEPGTDTEVELFDGSRITLQKLKENYDPTDRTKAVMEIQNAVATGKFLTGLIYYDDSRMDFAQELGLGERSLSTLSAKDLTLTAEKLEEINKELMK